MFCGAGGVWGGPSGRSGLRGVRLGGGCRGSRCVPPGHRVRGLLRSVGLRPWGVRPALCGARALSPPRGRAGGAPSGAVSGRRVAVSCGVSVLVRGWLGVLGVCGVRSGARPSRGPVGSGGGAVVRVCGVSRWRVVGAPVGPPFFACAPEVLRCGSRSLPRDGRYVSAAEEYPWIEHGQSQSQRQGQKVGGQEKSWPPQKWSPVAVPSRVKGKPFGYPCGYP